VTVTKLALIPSTGTELPDANGELETPNSSAEEGNGFVTATLGSPVKIDLLNLTGDNVATLLNRFFGVPAGEYSKIRVYYDNVVGCSGSVETLFHPTADYHFDVHFVGGNLVIPVTTDSQGGIRFFSVVINVVGLKYHQAGKSGNVLLRPQVFATVDNSSLQYIVSGVAQNVDPADNTFDIHTPGGTIVPAAFGATTGWIYIDNTVFPSRASSTAGEVLGASGLDNGAIVDVIGTFSSDNVLLAEKVAITFPDVLTGDVFLTWKSDNTFDLRIPTGDNTVFPMPTRTTAYYDNAVDFTQLSDTSIVDNAAIIARGYKKAAGGIDAFWISVGP
jgi:hypothetical protein